MKNNYEIRGDVTAIFIKRRDGTILECLIDTQDFSRVSAIPQAWGYSADNHYVGSRLFDRKYTYLHRFLTDCPKGMTVDHIDLNKLNNRRSNLRVVTMAQNAQNKTAQANNKSSGIRGIWWSKYHRRWKAGLKVGDKTIHVGYFDDIATAEKAIKNARAVHMPYSAEGEAPETYSYNPETDLNNEERKNKSCGIRNVTWSNKVNKWAVNVYHNRKQHWMGYCDTLDEAAKKAKEAKEKLMQQSSNISA